MHAAPSSRISSASARGGHGGALDERVEPIEVAGLLPEAFGTFGVAAELECRPESEEGFAIQRVGLDRDPEIIERRLHIASRQSQPAPEAQRGGRRFGRSLATAQPLPYFAGLARCGRVVRSPRARRSAVQPRSKWTHRGGPSVHSFRQGQPRPAIAGIGVDISFQRGNSFVRVPRVVAQQAPVKCVVECEVGKLRPNTRNSAFSWVRRSCMP